MPDWTQGYVADLNYTFGYYRELNPAQQALITLNQQKKPLDLAADFTYCELGYGQGFGLNLLAACYPKAQFYGTDFNPSHLLHGQSIADAAGLANIHLYEDGFAEFGDRPELPDFDVIVLHGIWSWIDRPTQQHLLDFIRSKLKPGGLVHVSYNCYPGWAPMRPLRDLMNRVAPPGTATSLERLDRAIAFLNKLKADGVSSYFGTNPTVGSRFDKILGQPRNYLAHEFFNENWEPKYFHEVADAFGEAKLGFLASAHLANQIDVIQHNEPQRKMLAEIADPVLRETTRDYIQNQQFRRDIFARGSEALSAEQQGRRAGETRFILTRDPSKLTLTQKFTAGEVTLQEDIYQPIWQAMAAGPVSLNEIMALDAIKPRGTAAAWQACLITCAIGYADPCLPEAGDEVEAEARADACHRFNRAIMERARIDDRYRFLASPVTGNGHVVSRLHQLFMLFEGAGQADPALAAWEALSALGQKLMHEGKTLQSAEENLNKLRQEFAGYESQGRPVYRKLGMV